MIKLILFAIVFLLLLPFIILFFLIDVKWILGFIIVVIIYKLLKKR